MLPVNAAGEWALGPPVRSPARRAGAEEGVRMNDDSDSDGEAARSSGEPFAEDGLALGFGRIVVSEIEAPNLVVNLVEGG